MSHTSPASFLVWALISIVLGAFLLFHLWSFDRFRCLRWNSGPSSGAFKRIMTYSYLLSVPLLLGYSVGNAGIKYHEGFISHPTLGIIPKPYQLWEPHARASIFPLMLMFSVAWSLEMVTHLEELCFWMFLVNSGSAQQNWFRSVYFKTWVIGSGIAVLYMPLVTIFTRSDPLKSEAYTFLAGSLGSLSLTIWFTPILWTFPNFLNNLRREGVDINTIVRLTKFSELNTIRVVFRFLFTAPLLILGIDGVRPHKHINESMFLTDLLACIAGFGCVISSGITLVIFFPRSIEGEIALRDASKERKRTRLFGRTASVAASRGQLSSHGHGMGASGTYMFNSSPKQSHYELQSTPDDYYEDIAELPRGSLISPKKPHKAWIHDEEQDIVPEILPPIRPNRKQGPEVVLGGIDGLSESNLSVHNIRFSNVNPMVHNFTSPIDFVYSEAQSNNNSRLTFRRE